MILTDLGFQKKYTTDSTNDPKQRIYFNPSKATNPFGVIQELLSKKPSYSINYATVKNMRSAPYYVVKNGKSLSFLSQVEFTDYLKNNKQLQEITFPEKLILSADSMKDKRNQKAKDLFDYDELECTGMNQFGFKDDPENPLHVSLTNKGQMKWSADDQIKAEQIAKAVNFATKHKRFMHVNTLYLSALTGISDCYTLSKPDFDVKSIEKPYDSGNISLHIASRSAPAFSEELLPNVDILDDVSKKNYDISNMISSDKFEREVPNPLSLTPVTNAAERSKLIRDLNNDLKNGSKWEAVAATLLPGELVSIGRGSYSEKQCYVHAVTHDPMCAQAWVSLGRLLNVGERIEVDGESLNKNNCFQKAQAIFSKKDTSKASLSYIRNFFGSQKSNIKTYDHILKTESDDLRTPLLELIDEDLTDATAITQLASQLLPDEHASFGRGLFEAEYIYKSALQINPRISQAWIGVGRLMSSSEVLEINGKEFSQKDCFAIARNIFTS